MKSNGCCPKLAKCLTGIYRVLNDEEQQREKPEHHALQEACLNPASLGTTVGLFTNSSSPAAKMLAKYLAVMEPKLTPKKVGYHIYKPNVFSGGF